MKERKIHIAIFAAVTFFYWSSIFSHMSIISGYAEDLGASATYVGIISGAYGLSQVILRLPLGFLSDKLKNRKIFITGATVATMVAGIIMFYAKSPKELLTARIICGAAGCAFVQLTILFSSYFDEAKSAKSVSTIVAISNMSQMAGMLAGGFAGNLFGKKYVFLLMAMLAGAGFILSLFVLDRPTHTSFELKGFRQAVLRKSFIVSTVLAIVCLILAYGKSFTFVPLLANRIGASPFQQSIIAALFSSASIISALFCARKGIDIKKVLTVGFIIHAAGSFLILLKHTVFVLCASQVLSGLGNGLLFSLLMTVSLMGVNENLRGTSMGIFQAVYGLGMIVGPVAIGAVVEKTTLNTGFAATGALALLAAVFTFFFITVNNSRQQSDA